MRNLTIEKKQLKIIYNRNKSRSGQIKTLIEAGHPEHVAILISARALKELHHDIAIIAKMMRFRTQ